MPFHTLPTSSKAPKIQRALLSVFEKNHLVEVVQALNAQSIELVATGSTAEHIKKHGFPCKEVSEITGFPEILDGRVKTLHPYIHAGILAKPDAPDHQQILKTHKIKPFDLVVTGLYPFESTLDSPHATFNEVLEMIDIGGPTIIRAAAKNHQHVCVITQTSQYPQLLEELKHNNGAISLAFRQQCAKDAFALTAHYDAAIALWLAKQHHQTASPLLHAITEVKQLAYGENHHQQAHLYKTDKNHVGAVNATPLQEAKALGYNNYVDADFAFSIVAEFCEPAVSVIKHKGVCGFCCHKDPVTTLKSAIASDPESAFGGIIATNQTITLAMAMCLDNFFLEVLIAPDFDQGALQQLKNKKNLRILATGSITKNQETPPVIKQLRGGFLVQSPNVVFPTREMMKVTTQGSEPSTQQWSDIETAVKLASFANSNAIVIVADGQLIGVGSGQTSRVRACNIATEHAKNFHPQKLAHAVVASDGFFPFFDGIQTLANAGIGIIAHPGGSKNDQSIIDDANLQKMTLIQHGIRSFSH